MGDALLSPFIFSLGRRYEPKPKAEVDHSYWDLDYSGYHKNLIQ